METFFGKHRKFLFFHAFDFQENQKIMAAKHGKRSKDKESTKHYRQLT